MLNGVAQQRVPPMAGSGRLSFRRPRKSDANRSSNYPVNFVPLNPEEEYPAGDFAGY